MMIHSTIPQVITPPALFNIYKTEESEEIKFLKRISRDINFYFKMTGFKPTWQQRQLVDAFVAGESNIAVRSGKGPGKTCATANCVTWWSLSNANSRAIVTAPTMRQCQDVWMAEAKKWVTNGDPRLSYFMKFQRTSYKVLGEDPPSWGCLLATATKPENLQGIHNEKLLIYCEEASGISGSIMQVIQDTLSGNKNSEKYGKANNRWLAVGNPNTRGCRFFDFFHSLNTKPWTCFKWNAEETPESSWFSHERNKDLEEEFGRDSDIYRIGVLGEFPKIDHDVVISYEDVKNAYGKEAYNRVVRMKGTRKQVGIDLARWGGDELALVFTQGGIVLHADYRSKVEISAMIREADMYQKRLGWKNEDCLYIIDTDGMGQGAVSFIGDSKVMGKRIHEFHTNARASKKRVYANKMTEAWFNLARKFRRGEIYLGDKQDKKLIDQLCGRKFETNKDGQLLLESKKTYVKRMKTEEHGTIGASPDRAEAIAMAFYEGEVTSRIA